MEILNAAGGYCLLMTVLFFVPLVSGAIVNIARMSKVTWREEKGGSITLVIELPWR